MNKFKKLFNLLFLTFLFTEHLFSYDGLMAGKKNVKYIQTQWFDIIYPPESELNAKALSLQADEIYLKICNDLNIKPSFRMPVVITYSTDNFNAYFNNYTYNHIVLYDTLPEESMTVHSSENLINTFVHELNHAVTINMRNSFWQNLDELTSDYINYGNWVVMNRMIKEGASIAEESTEGEGRLNDGFYLHMIEQSKLNGKMPKWQDVIGSRDVYPSLGMSYGAGGPFIKYLQDTYGMQKYSDFWYFAINMKRLNFRSVFKKAFGKSIDKVWNDFLKSIPVADNVEYKNTDAYYFNKKIKNNKGSRYISLTQSKDSFAYLDSSCNKIYLNDKLYLSRINTNAVNLSADGKFMVIEWTSENSESEKYKISICNVKNKNQYTVNETGLRDGTVIKNNDNYYLCAVKISGQNMFINIYKLNMNAKENVKECKLIKQIPVKDNDMIFSLEPCNDNGGLALIYKHELEWSVRLYDLSDLENINFVSCIIPLENIRIRYLSPSFENKTISGLSFSYVLDEKHIPSLGFIDLQNKDDIRFYYDEKNISGGIYYPVIKNNILYYSGNFINDIKLFKTDFNKSNLLQMNCTILNEAVDENKINSENSIERQTLLSEFDEKNYKVSDYSVMHYITVPLLPVELSYYDMNGSSNYYSITSLGINFNDPWDGNESSIKLMTDPFNLYGGIGFKTSGGSVTSSFYYSDSLTALGSFYSDNENYFKNASNLFEVGSSLFTGNNSYITLSLLNNAFAGNNFDDWKKDNTEYYADVNEISFGYSFYTYGSGTYETSGFSISAVYQDMFYGSIGNVEVNNILDLKEGEKLDLTFYQNVYPELSISLSHLIPIDCYYGYTYNLPLGLNFALVPDNSDLIKANARLILFAKQIQKGFYYLPFYVNRIAFLCDYAGKIKHKNNTFEIKDVVQDFKDCKISDVKNTLDFMFMVVCGPNFGSLANPQIHAGLGIGIRTEFNSSECKNDVVFKFSTSL